MKITHAQVVLTKVPTKRPHRMSFATTNFQNGVHLWLYTDDGIVGLGETAHMAGYSDKGETQSSVALQLRERLIPAILGKDPMQIERRQADLDKVIPWNPRAKSVINLALFDMVGKALQTPVYNLLGGLFRERIPLSSSLPITDPKAASTEACEMVERGLKILKLKVGHENPLEDIERFRQVRLAVGNGISLRADANQAWDVPTAIRVIRELEPYQLEFMEQPVKAWDLDGLAEVRHATNTYIMADESANSPMDVLNLAKHRAVDLISIYIVNSGGISGAQKMAHVAEPAGIGCYLGGALDGAISGRAGLHFAASTPNLIWGCEMGGIFLLEEDLGVEPILYENGSLLVPQLPGLGVEFDREKIEKYKIDAFNVYPT
jgi:muconate cycloisomerase